MARVILHASSHASRRAHRRDVKIIKAALLILITLLSAGGVFAYGSSIITSQVFAIDAYVCTYQNGSGTWTVNGVKGFDGGLISIPTGVAVPLVVTSGSFSSWQGTDGVHVASPTSASTTVTFDNNGRGTCVGNLTANFGGGATTSTGQIEFTSPDPSNFHYYGLGLPSDFYTTYKTQTDTAVKAHYDAIKYLMTQWGINSASQVGCPKFEISFSRGGGGVSGGCGAGVGLGDAPNYWSDVPHTTFVITGETVNVLASAVSGTGGFPRTWWIDDIWYFPVSVASRALTSSGHDDITQGFFRNPLESAYVPSYSMYGFWNTMDVQTIGRFLKQIKTENLHFDDQRNARKLWLDESACLIWGDDGYVNQPGLSIKSTYIMVLLAYSSGQNIKASIVNYQVQDNMQPTSCQDHSNTPFTPMQVDSAMYDAVKQAHDIVVTLPYSDPRWQYWRSGDYDKISGSGVPEFPLSGNLLMLTFTIIAATIVILRKKRYS